MRPIGHLALIAALSMLLGGCATRGRLAVECGDFVNYVHALPYSRIESDIRNSRPGGEPAAQAAMARAAGAVMADRAGKVREPDLAAALAAGWVRRDARANARRLSPAIALSPAQRAAVERAEQPSVLLLSGGGQWGAFGAGLLTSLAGRNPPALPNPVVITGVSTGTLQMLFVGAGLENQFVRDALRTAYLPDHESEVVDRQPQLLAVFTGAIAGLKPLRRRLEDALCPDDALRLGERAKARPDCPMLDRLAASPVVMRAGFVEAKSGLFEYADINGLAQSAKSAREKRSCIAGAALASVAMPVFFQQVTVDHTTYFDGGVRQSVFASDALLQLRRLPNQRGELPLYVLRNGPTDVEIDAAANDKLNALDAALRAERIIVNQVEVSSVASLRLEDPYGYLGFTSADGWHDQLLDPSASEPRTCGDIKDAKANRNAQFIPDFMRCLMRYGDRRVSDSMTTPPPGAMGMPIWTAIANVGATTGANRPPANDDDAANDN